MKIFCTGVTGYIGGSVAVALAAQGHSVCGLVRDRAGADTVRALGIEPLLGTLDDVATLKRGAEAADAVFNMASADHEGAASALLKALEGSGKPFIHTSGSSIVGTPAGGRMVERVYDETTRFTPSPARAARVALNEQILSYAGRGVRVVIVCPSLIYGLGTGPKPHSIQVPWLIETARKHEIARHLGPGENVWSDIHVDDLVELYVKVLADAPSGAFYFAENGEHSMRELCRAINRMLGFDGEPLEMTPEEAAAEWGEGPAQNTMGSNSRVRAVRARSELGWAPHAKSVIEEIERGCYATP